MEKKRYLGIDIGSTTFKAVLLGEDGKVERTVYKRTQPIDSGKVACTGHCSGCGACGGGASKRPSLPYRASLSCCSSTPRIAAAAPS